MIRVETLGFWFSPYAPSSYPRPERLVGGGDPDRRAAVLAHLRRGTVAARYAAPSFCRFACGVTDADLGATDLTDGRFVWPAGLAHYVEAHDVRLPDSFVDHTLAAPAPVPLPRARRYDDTPWLTWGRGQGACLDLVGWEVPGAVDRAKIRAAFGAAAPPEDTIVLARADTRQVVVARAGGALEIHQLTPDRPPPRQLAGWDAWPVLPAS